MSIERGVRSVDEAYDFLVREAEVLDANDVAAWLDMLDPEISYRMPVRITRDRASTTPFSAGAWHMNEDYSSLRIRAERLDGDYAWAEDPPSRTRRFVTNIRATDEPGGLVHVVSNLLVFRSRYDSTDHQLISGERRDVLRRSTSSLVLLERLILLDHTTLGTPNLGIFF